MPRFTIVIPTRDRADLAAIALASVSEQDFADFEVVVSDNSTTTTASDAVHHAVAAAADPRVRLVRPPRPLVMHEHWEFATSDVAGEYLLILTDRFAMRPGTLTVLAALIDRHRPDILTWTTEAAFELDGRFVQTPHPNAVAYRTGRSVLDEFAQLEQWRSGLLGSNRLPRGLNSAVRNDLVRKIRAEHGAFYVALSPDYTSAFQQLAAGHGVVQIDQALYVGHGQSSNGQQSLKLGSANFADQFDVDLFEGCPLPIDTVINSVIRDYLWVGRLPGVDLPPIDPVGYLLINWRELQIKRELDSPLDTAAMARSILNAAAVLPTEQRAAFDQGRALIDGRETATYRLRNLLARHNLLAPLKHLAAMVRAGGEASQPRYRDVLEAMAANPLVPLNPAVPEYAR